MSKIKELFTAENIKKGLKWFFFSFIWLAILMFIIDIVSKQLIMAFLNVGDRITLIPNFLHITYVQNDGMAFGIDTGNKIANIVLFVSVSLIGAAVILGFLIKKWKSLNKMYRASLMLMLSGCIGNLIDRAFYVEADGTHFVVDFIDFQFGKGHFPSFNVADSCLVVGVIMLLVYMIVKDIKDELHKKNESSLKTVGEVKDSNSNNETLEIKTKEETTKVEENTALNNNDEAKESNDETSIK